MRKLSVILSIFLIAIGYQSVAQSPQLELIYPDDSTEYNPFKGFDLGSLLDELQSGQLLNNLDLTLCLINLHRSLT